MPELDRTPTFSIVIEWENARFAELERTRRMLRALRRQLLELPPPVRAPEIILLYDRLLIDGDMVERVVEAELAPGQLPAAVRIVPTEGLRYYEQKNTGAALSSGEIVILLDCDVVPEPGWLGAMLAAFADPRVEIAAGQSYVECSSLYARAFALFWFFELRDDSSELCPTGAFHANNVGWRREVIRRYPFPAGEGYRAQGDLLIDALRSDGVGLYVQKRARVAHPCPVGSWYFAARALNQGRDSIIVEARRRRNRLPWRTVYWGLRSALLSSWRRFRRDRRKVGLSRIGAVVAFGIGLAYLGLATVGAMVTLVRPKLVGRLFPI